MFKLSLRRAFIIKIFSWDHWRTGGGGGALAPSPQMKLNHDLFSMYQQNIEIIAV